MAYEIGTSLLRHGRTVPPGEGDRFSHGRRVQADDGQKEARLQTPSTVFQAAARRGGENRCLQVIPPTKVRVTKQMPLILLDLDETLVHSAHEHVPGFETFRHTYTMQVCHVRPHAKELLRYVEKRVHRGQMTAGVWSTGKTFYVYEIIRRLCHMAGVSPTIFNIVLTRDHTPLLPMGYVKMLSILDDSDVLLVDDSERHADHPANRDRVIKAPPFRAQKRDDGFLKWLPTALDVRYGWCPVWFVF